LVGVDEDGVGGELVVEVDQVGEVGGCFAAAGGVGDEEVRSGFAVGGVDEGDGVAVCLVSAYGLVWRKWRDEYDVLVTAVIQQPGQIFRLCRG
jgi:hypothetical protein